MAHVRKRPLLAHERERGDDALSVSSGRLVALVPDEARPSPHVHAPLGLPALGRGLRRRRLVRAGLRGGGGALVRHALGGGRAALFMYGQTGSGKTFTMEAMHGLAATMIFEEGAPRTWRCWRWRCSASGASTWAAGRRHAAAAAGRRARAARRHAPPRREHRRAAGAARARRARHRGHRRHRRHARTRWCRSA